MASPAAGRRPHTHSPHSQAPAGGPGLASSNHTQLAQTQNTALPPMHVTDYVVGDDHKRAVLSTVQDWPVAKSGWLLRNDAYAIKNRTRNIKGVLDIRHSKEIYIHPLHHIEHANWRLAFAELRGSYVFLYAPDCLLLVLRIATEAAHTAGRTAYTLEDVEAAIETVNKMTTARFLETVPLTLVQYAPLSHARADIASCEPGANGFNDISAEHLVLSISGPDYGAPEPSRSGKRKPATIDLEVLLPQDLDPECLLNDSERVSQIRSDPRKQARLRRDLTHDWANALRRLSSVNQPLEQRSSSRSTDKDSHEPNSKPKSSVAGPRQPPSSVSAAMAAAGTSGASTGVSSSPRVHKARDSSSTKDASPSTASGAIVESKPSSRTRGVPPLPPPGVAPAAGPADTLAVAVASPSTSQRPNRATKVLQLWNKAKKTRQVFIVDEDKLNTEIVSAKPTDNSAQVPILLRQCIDMIERIGLDGEGLYRLSGSSASVKTLRKAYEDNAPNGVNLNDSGKDAVWNNDIHVLTGCVKGYLRDGLQPWDDSLCMYKHYDDFIQLAQVSNVDLRLLALRELIHRLHPNHFITLQYLLKHLSRVSQQSATNKMTARNLAIVFGPTILQSNSPNTRMLADMPHQCLIVEEMIKNCDAIFSNEPVLPEKPQLMTPKQDDVAVMSSPADEMALMRAQRQQQQQQQQQQQPPAAPEKDVPPVIQQATPTRGASHAAVSFSSPLVGESSNNSNSPPRVRVRNAQGHQQQQHLQSSQNVRTPEVTDTAVIDAQSHRERISSKRAPDALTTTLVPISPAKHAIAMTTPDKVTGSTADEYESEAEDQVYSEEDFSLDFERVKRAAPRLSLHLSTLGSGKLDIDFTKLNIN